MANQGRSLTGKQIIRIIDLLASTEMPLAQIAERMGCSKSAIIAVNRKHGVRDYSGQRSRWKVRLNKKEEVRSRVS
jgi:IS30 family transposase